MPEFNLFENGITRLRAEISAGHISAEVVATSFLERIHRFDPIFNSFIEVNEEILTQAREIHTDDPRPLAGIPISIKDLILTRDLPTTGGSKAPLPIPQNGRDARVVRALRNAGALIIGKTSLHEFAFGVTNENAHFGPVRNPWNPERVSGGSSGGSAASVALRMSAGSIGTDTRGSIRIPASCCGVCGFKPTRGVVSTAGAVPLSWTLDHVGPLAPSVDDLKILFDVIRRRRTVAQAPAKEPSAFRLATIPYYQERIDPQVLRAVKSAIDVFRSEGHEVIEIELPGLREVVDASDVISRAEAVTVHNEGLTRWPELYDPGVRERLSTGYQLSAMELVRAERRRVALTSSFQTVFRKADCFVAPALPVVAPPIGTTSVVIGEKQENLVTCFVRLMAIQNMAGLPALCLPCGFSSDNMPIGMQLIGPRGADDAILSLGARFQQLTSWQRRVPTELRERLS